MSSRALRRAQRDREEQQRLESGDTETRDEDTSPERSRAAKSVFALLHDADEASGEDIVDEEQAEEEEDVDDSVVQAQHREVSIPVATIKGKSKKKKKKAKTTKSAGQAQVAENASELDDIDKALQELAVKQGGPSSGATAAAVDTGFDDACRLLAVDRDNLHVQNEMKKLFGRAALDEEENDEQPGQRELPEGLLRRQRRGVQHNGRQEKLHGAALTALRRNIFVQGKEDWPQATGSGLGMEVVQKQSNGVVEYRYVHHRVYQEVQQEFDVCVESMNPEMLIALMHKHPAHVSTLLQVSELLKSERQHAQSRDILERALFTLGRAVHSTFAKTLGEGKARLDFRRPENRELWLGGWRYMQNLAMRATWRTAYDWSKLLLAISPDEDPYAMWLVIDQHALRSKQDLDFLNLSRAATLSKAHKGLPSIQISQGLAEHRSGNKSKGQQTLYTAISRHPWFVARLMQELDIDAPPAIWGQQPRNDREALHASLYAVRAKDIWNTPEHSALLLETASAIPTGMQAAPAMDPNITLDEARHVILSDIPALIEMVPREFTAMYTSASDPLPPLDSTDSYERQKPGRPMRSNGAQPQFLNGLNELLVRLTNGEHMTEETRNEITQSILDGAPAQGRERLAQLLQELPQADYEQAENEH